MTITTRRTAFFVIALICLGFPVIAQTTVSATGWRFAAGSGEPVPLDGGFPLVAETEKAGSASPGAAFEADFAVPTEWSGPLGIVLYKNAMSCRVFVNGSYIDTIGRPGPDFFFHPFITKSVLVPQSLLKENNTLRLELWSDTGTYKLRKIDFMDEDSYRAAFNRFNFLDIQLNRFASVILLFVCLYSLFLYMSYRERREILYLSLASLFFAAFLMNISLLDSPLPYLLTRALLYACFPISIIAIFQFFRIFFKMKTNRVFNIIVIGAGAFFSVGYFLQPTSAALDGWQSLMLVYPMSAIAYGIAGGVKSIRAGNRSAAPLLIGLFFTLAFSAYDVYFFVGDVTPTVLLQGIGFMGMIIGTFYSFSQEVADANRKVAEYSLEMEKNKAARDMLFTQIQIDSIKSQDAGVKLDKSIERVGALVTQYLASSAHINDNIHVQSEQVRANKNDIDKILAALQQTRGMVERHENLVQVTVKNMKELAEGIHRTDALVKESGSTIARLTNVCREADKDVAESSRFVDDLASYSQNINDIVKSIGDLSEQTNILAINAAIEAARSGHSGKGFAVVAQEIRSLASKSGESASKIKSILGTMIEKISNIQRQESQVSHSLKNIINENSNIEASISEIFSVLEKQLERNDTISGKIAELVAAVQSILEQTSMQQRYGETISQSIHKLESINTAIVATSEDQKQCNEELKENLKQLRSVSENNLDVVEDLKSLIV